MDESTHEKNLSQTVQTIKKYSKIAITFLIGSNGIFNVTNENKKIYLAISTTQDGFYQITVPPVAYELESSNEGHERISIEEGHYTEEKYPIFIKPFF